MSKDQRLRSPGRFTHRDVKASGSCSGERGNVLAVGTYCYVAVCTAGAVGLAALGASAPTEGGERVGGILWRPPAYSLLTVITGKSAPICKLYLQCTFFSVSSRLYFSNFIVLMSTRLSISSIGPNTHFSDACSVGNCSRIFSVGLSLYLCKQSIVLCHKRPFLNDTKIKYTV